MDSGTCHTDNVTIHARMAFGSEEPCPEGQHQFILPDISGSISFCYDVSSLADLTGPYYTTDGGETWTMSTIGQGRAMQWSGSPRFLRPSNSTDTVIMPFDGLISTDNGATFNNVVSWPDGVIDAAITPDGDYLFLLTEWLSTALHRYKLSDGTFSTPVEFIATRFLNSVWSLRLLPSGDVLVAARLDKTDKDGYRAMYRVNPAYWSIAAYGPVLEGVAAWAAFASGPLDAPTFILVDVNTVGRTLYRLDTKSDTWTLVGQTPGPAAIHILDKQGTHLVSGSCEDMIFGGGHRSRDGGESWQALADSSQDDIDLYASVLCGDRLCAKSGADCESWTTAFPSGVANVQPPSLVWHRADDECVFKISTGNLPILEALPQMELAGPAGLAPLSIQAMGADKAVLFLGNRTPPIGVIAAGSGAPTP